MIKYFQELFKSATDVAIERIATPFTGAFLLSWCVWNWKLFYYVLTVEGKITFVERVNYIENEIFGWVNCLAGPLVVALAAVYVYPLFSGCFLKAAAYYEKRHQRIRMDADNNMGLTSQQAAELRANHSIQLAKLQSENNGLDKRITELSAENSAHQGKIKEIDNQNAILLKEIDTWEKKFMLARNLVDRLYGMIPEDEKNDHYGKPINISLHNEIVSILHKS